nr:hypothetical protein [Hankyongella ginsenosidimutans]
MENVDVGADEPGGVKVAQFRAQRGFVGLHHLLHRVVHVHDGVVVIGDHDRGLAVVEGAADPHVLGGDLLQALLGGDAVRLVIPLDDSPDAIAGRVEQRRCDQIEDTAADPNGRAMRGAQALDHIALVRGADMEDVGRLANQIPGIEVWQLRADRRFIALHHVPHGAVHVNDAKIGIRDHDIGLHIFHRGHDMVADRGLFAAIEHVRD